MTTVTGEQTITIEPIDVMTFDDQVRITSMCAFWSRRHQLRLIRTRKRANAC